VFKRVLSILILTFFAFSSVHAQGGWSIFLFNPQDGSITQVRSSGEAAGSFVLPLPQAFNRYGNFAEVSLSGRYIAYTAYDSTTERPNVQLFVLDRDLSATRFTYDVTDAVTVDGDTNNIPVVFDEVNQQIAFGLLTEGNGWQVVVGDFATSAPLATLTAADAPVLKQTPNILPVVQRYDGVHVWFTAVAYGTGVQAVYPAFRWHIGTGEVVEDETFTHPISDFDPFSGQVVVAVRDESLDSAEGTDGQFIMNAVEVVGTDGSRSTLYNETEGSVQRVIFIEVGARVLIEVYNFETDETKLKVLNRDGSVAGEIIGSLDDITGTPDGFVGLFDGGMAHVNTTVETFSPETVWSGSPDVSLIGVILDADFITPVPPSFQD
jgi:hypothetical protein